MKPQKPDIQYEKIDVNELVTGYIDEIQYDQAHKFKGFQGGEDKIRAAVRFKFMIDGCKHLHYSRWMTFSYGEKTSLFLKYLVPLVEGATPDFDFDLDQLKGMKVKMMWSEKNEFQSVDTIRPFGGKLKPKTDEVVVNDEDFGPLEPPDEEPHTFGE